MNIFYLIAPQRVAKREMPLEHLMNSMNNQWVLRMKKISQIEKNL